MRHAPIFLVTLLAACGGLPPEFAAENAADLTVSPLARATPAISRTLGPGLRTPVVAPDPHAPDPTPPPPAPVAATRRACPATGICRVMPLGDSITDGGTSGAVGYRPPLWHLATGAGMSLNFVGSLTGGPDLVDGLPWPRKHEGHSGWSIDVVGDVMTGLQAIAADRVTAYQPDVVLLMIGTNDVQLDFELATAPARLSRLLATIATAKPDVAVILSTILPTQDGAQNVKVDAFNASLPGVVTAEQNAGHRVALVDAHAAFVAHPNYASELLADKLHPTDAGYAILAAKWFAALTQE